MLTRLDCDQPAGEELHGASVFGHTKVKCGAAEVTDQVLRALNLQQQTDTHIGMFILHKTSRC